VRRPTWSYSTTTSPASWTQSRKAEPSFENIRKFLTYILTSNVPESVPYLAFVFARVPLALTIMHILAVDLGTDMIPALGLGAEPPDAAVMRRSLRRRSERLLTPGLVVCAYLFLGTIEAIAAMAAFFFVRLLLDGSGAGVVPSRRRVPPGHDRVPDFSIVLKQVINVQICRHRREPLVSRSLFANHLIVAGVAAEIGLILMIDYTAIGNSLFGTWPIGLTAWLFVLPFAAAMLGLEELKKGMFRRASLVKVLLELQSCGISTERRIHRWATSLRR
jgi:sodium/potassium-transporting ATPase subunit alpha